MDLIGPLMDRFSGLPCPGSSESPVRGADEHPTAPVADDDGGVDEDVVEPPEGGAEG